ncbi:hypothetical protein FUT83_07820 [Treponema phagedenis]|nr:hypothetical protein FUT83_07820 [Treponema phagedenis]QEK09335.1 hypothetical protein FUT81_07730 [Treponema phagedenis]
MPEDFFVLPFSAYNTLLGAFVGVFLPMVSLLTVAKFQTMFCLRFYCKQAKLRTGTDARGSKQKRCFKARQL